MSVALPQIRVGEVVRHESLSVFPLFSESAAPVDYRLSDAALAEKSLLVEEVSRTGSVPDLLVQNTGDVRVLFLEGEELIGAKQNRILNTSVLVAAHSKLQVPVSCVEQGRWRHTSQYFRSSGSQVPSKLRRALKASVSQSVKEKKSYASHQGAVWHEVACLHAAHQVDSESAAMSDAFDTYQDRIGTFQANLRYVDGATGMAVAIGSRIVSVDLFDKPATCREVWHRILSGVVFDALEAGKTDSHASAHDVEQLVAAAGDLPWQQAPAVGEGEEYRAASRRGDHASALAFGETVVHASLVTAV